MRQVKSQLFVTIFSVLLVISVLTVSGIVYAQSADVNRSIADSELAPGETTTVTVNISLDESSSIQLTDSFSPAFADVQVVDGNADFPVAENDQVIADWTSESDAVIQYEVTVPEDAADGDEFAFDGTVDIDGNQQAVGGDSSITVSEPEEASVTVADQESTGESIVVGEAVPGPDSESLGVWTRSNDQLDELLGSVSLDAVLENESLSLDSPLATDQNVTVAIHAGGPATDNILASDTASITIVEDDSPTENTTERSISATELIPGDSTTVTVSVDLTEEVSEFDWNVEFTPAFADAEFVDTADASFPTLDPDQGLASWADVQSFTFSYEVTVPDDAQPGEEFAFDGQVSGSIEKSVTGDQRIEIADVPETEGHLQVSNQSVPAGDQLVIDEANTSLAYAVVVELGDGTELGTSEPLEAGENISDYTVELDQPLEKSDEVVVRLATVTEDGEIGTPIQTADGYLETSVSVEVGADVYSDDSEFGPNSVFSAIEDWRAGEIDPGLVFEVIENWRAS